MERLIRWLAPGEGQIVAAIRAAGPEEEEEEEE